MGRVMKKSLGICLLSLWLILSLVPSLSIRVSAHDDSEYLEVNLEYLAGHMEDFDGMRVGTKGTVYFMSSFYMYVDFWLDRAIPVVVRFAGLSTPPEGSFIEVQGVIEYSRIEGGFYYLNAHSWAYADPSVAEFPSFLILPLFMIATLLIVIIYKRKHYVTANDVSFFLDKED
jgi:hypothetical protein